MKPDSDEAIAAAVLDPPLRTAAVPGVGGILRAQPEDFDVEEIPAYPADGRGNAHLLVPLRKRLLATEDAVREVARQLGLSRGEIGVAGKKDRDAVTRQWISVPASATDRLGGVEHESFTLGAGLAHGNKLKIGHLRGNRFVLAVRGLAAVDDPVASAQAAFDAIDQDGGLLNVYGGQRFGRGAADVDRGLAEVRKGRGGRRGNMVVAAGQAALFNLYVAERAHRGLLHTVIDGDLLRKTNSGGLFWSSDAAEDQPRFDAGEIELTGPIYGSRMRAPPADSSAAALELAVLERANVDPTALKKLGRAALGTRRALRAQVTDVRVGLAPAIPESELACGLQLHFTLPSGSYATLVAREIMLPIT